MLLIPNTETLFEVLLLTMGIKRKIMATKVTMECSEPNETSIPYSVPL